MRSPITLICRDTGEAYDAAEPRWRSERGGLLDIAFTPMLRSRMRSPSGRRRSGDTGKHFRSPMM